MSPFCCEEHIGERFERDLSLESSAISSAALRLEDLYGPLHALETFLTPNQSSHLSFMSDSKAVELASDVLEQVIKSPFRRVVVMESGARPLAEICMELAKKRGLKIKWDFLKVPRDLKASLPSLINYYLRPEEREEALSDEKIRALRKVFPWINSAQNSRSCCLHSLCSKIPGDFFSQGVTLAEKLNQVGQAKVSHWKSAFEIVLSGTSLERFFCEPFLLFDEYSSTQSLQRMYGFNNSGLDSFLSSRGFLGTIIPSYKPTVGLLFLLKLM